MKNCFKFLILVNLMSTTLPAHASEDWKGEPYLDEFSTSVLSGIGWVNGVVGFGLHGTVAKKILHRGFIDDLNDQVFIETQFGALFVTGGTAFPWSVHLRWDFHQNTLWTFYATGGLGGTFTGAALGNITQFFPRFGVGAYWNKFEFVSVRFLLNQDFIGAGVGFVI